MCGCVFRQLVSVCVCEWFKCVVSVKPDTWGQPGQPYQNVVIWEQLNGLFGNVTVYIMECGAGNCPRSILFEGRIKCGSPPPRLTVVDSWMVLVCMWCVGCVWLNTGGSSMMLACCGFLGLIYTSYIRWGGVREVGCWQWLEHQSHPH